MSSSLDSNAPSTDSSLPALRRELLQMMIRQLQFYELNSLASVVASHSPELDPNYQPSNLLEQLVQAGRDHHQESRSGLALDSALPASSSSSGQHQNHNGTDATSSQHPWGPYLSAIRSDAETAKAPQFVNIFQTAHKMACTTGAFSLDGRYVATGSQDTSLKVLDVQKMKMGFVDGAEEKPLIRTMYDHTMVRPWQPVNDVAFHPNGRVLASCSDDCHIKLYDLQRVGVKRAFRFLQDSQPINSIAFHPSGDFLLAATETGPVRLYDVRYLKCYGPAHQDQSHMGPVNMVRYGLMGNLYATCSADGSIKVWDGLSGNCIRTMERAHQGTEVVSVALSKNTKFILSAGRDSEPKLWDLSSGKVVQRYQGAIQRQFPVNSAFSYHEEYVLGADEVTNDVVCWCTQTGKLLSRMSGHMDAVNRVVPSPTDSCFLSCGRDNRARFYGDVSESLVAGK